jgi:hypothetical protein
MTRNMRNQYEPQSSKVKVVNEDTGVTVEADVLSRSADRLSLAIKGNKVILSKNASGVYVGKLLGMSLRCNG